MVITTEDYLLSVLGPEYTKLDLDFGVGKYYFTHKIKKRSGGVRWIHAPQSPLIDVQNHFLYNFLYRFKTHNAAHGFVKGKSPKTGAEKHLKSEVLLNIDLKDFFPSIHISRVKSVCIYLIKRDLNRKKLTLDVNNVPKEFKEKRDLLAKLFPPRGIAPKIHETELIDYIAHKMSEVSCYRGELPQGSPCSPAIANLVSWPLDTILQRYCNLHNYIYTRYADDISISSMQKGETIDVKRIISFIKGSRFKVNYKKIRVSRTNNRMSVTGVVVNEKLSVPRWKWRNLRAKLHNLKKTNQTITKHEYQQIRGYCEWIKSLNTKRGEKLLASLGQITVKKN